MTAEKHNAVRMPRRFFARHMFPGVCGYDDEVVLVDADAMKRMIPTMEGVPIYIGHQPVNMAKLQEEADGYVVRCFYNERDGWLWAECLAISDEAHMALDNGWAVSNAYAPTEWGPGGKFHNVDYHRKVVNGEFKHLALVENPRYESAATFTPEQYQAYENDKSAQLKEFNNALDKPNPNGVTMFKVFKNKREEVTEIDAETMITLENGKTMSVQEMINAVKKNDEDAEAARKAAEEAAKKEKDNETEAEDDDMLNEDTEVVVGGQTMPLKELVNRYNTMSKKNEADDADKKTAEKGNEADKEDDKEKQNAKKNHFEELQNAHKVVKQFVAIDTSIDQLERGQQRYGSNKSK